MRLPVCANPCLLFLFWVISTGSLCASEPAEPTGLQFRRLMFGKSTVQSVPLPPDAVRVFLYDGEPRSIRVLEKQIAVDYGCSGVLFDRATGEVAARFTVAQGWPRVRPAGFLGEQSWLHRQHLVGPGLVEAWRPRTENVDHEKAAVAVFEGQTWEARQPAQPLRTLYSGTWTGALKAVNPQCQVVRLGPDGKIEKAFTQKDGLPGNIVTHLAVAQGALWASCVDIYDYEKKEWGIGGLARYRNGTWEHVKEIDGRSVRWVTLLQAVGDELWVGFLEGAGVAGDKITYGCMRLPSKDDPALYPEIYRPDAKTLVLARLKGGEWTTFARPVLPEKCIPETCIPPLAALKTPPMAIPSTVKPVQLAQMGNEILLFTRSFSGSRDFNIAMGGHLWKLSPGSGEWQTYSTEKDFDADELTEFIVDQGEVLVISNVGIHRWDAKSAGFKKLDPRCDLRNPCLHAATVMGDDLWIGYNKQTYGVYGQQGLSRFDETANRWEHWLPEKLETACPVQRMARLSSGELWILFQPRPWPGPWVLAPGAEYDFYDRERIPRPTGLGCLKDGQWSFLGKTPVEVENYARGDGTVRYYSKGPGSELVAIGDLLFLSTDEGLYRGPGNWKRIAEGEVRNLRPSKEADALLFSWTKEREKEPLLGRYDLKTEVCSSEKEPADQKAPNHDVPDPVVGDSVRCGFVSLAGSTWACLPKSTKEHDRWIFGPLYTDDERRAAYTVETPKAFWILMSAQAIRIDRRMLPE